MFLETLLSDQPSLATNWLFPDLLPQGQLAFLQGPTGVGKSLFAASLAAALYRRMAIEEPGSTDQYVLWHGSPAALPLHARYLRQQGVTVPQQSLRCLDVREVQETGDEAPDCFGYCLYDQAGCGTRLVVMDDLDLMYPQLFKMDEGRQRHFLHHLASIAEKHRLTILFLHQPRPSLPFWARNNPYNHFTLELRFHPADPRARLLTVVKNVFGITGSQFHVPINSDGVMTWQLLPHEERVLGNRSPKPASSKRQVNLQQLVATLRDMVCEPAPASEVKDLLSEEGYSQHDIRDALKLADLHREKRGSAWWYSLHPPATLAT